MSLDGAHLAVATVVKIDGYVRLGVDVYDLSAGKVVGHCEHDQVPPGRNQLLLAHFDWKGVQFTPDGARLISAANNLIKIWDVEGLPNR